MSDEDQSDEDFLAAFSAEAPGKRIIDEILDRATSERCADIIFTTKADGLSVTCRLSEGSSDSIAVTSIHRRLVGPVTAYIDDITVDDHLIHTDGTGLPATYAVVRAPAGISDTVAMRLVRES